MDVVGVSESELQDLALYLHAVTDTDEFLLDGEAGGDTGNHVVDECAVESVQGTVTGLVRGTCYRNSIPFNGYFDVRINLLTQLSERSFNQYHIVGADRCGHALRQVYRQFSNS